MKKLLTRLFLSVFISFVLILSCVEEPDIIEEEEEEGMSPGYILDVCKCHRRPLPDNLRRITNKCQSGTSQIIKCSREECKTEACLWFGTRCPYPYPYWKEICN